MKTIKKHIQIREQMATNFDPEKERIRLEKEREAIRKRIERSRMELEGKTKWQEKKKLEDKEGVPCYGCRVLLREQDFSYEYRGKRQLKALLFCRNCWYDWNEYDFLDKDIKEQFDAGIPWFDLKMMPQGYLMWDYMMEISHDVPDEPPSS